MTALASVSLASRECAQTFSGVRVAEAAADRPTRNADEDLRGGKVPQVVVTDTDEFSPLAQLSERFARR